MRQLLRRLLRVPPHPPGRVQSGRARCDVAHHVILVAVADRVLENFERRGANSRVDVLENSERNCNTVGQIMKIQLQQWERFGGIYLTS